MGSAPAKDRWLAGGIGNRQLSRQRHPDPHGAPIAVVPLEVRNGDSYHLGTGRVSAGRGRIVEVGRPASGGRKVDRAGRNDDGGSDAVQLRGLVSWLVELDGEIFEINAFRLVSLLEAVHQRATFNGHGAPQRIDPPAWEGKPRADSQRA